MLCLFVSQVAYISETSKELQNNDKINESAGFCLSRKFSEKLKRFLLVNTLFQLAAWYQVLRASTLVTSLVRALKLRDVSIL